MNRAFAVHSAPRLPRRLFLVTGIQACEAGPEPAGPQTPGPQLVASAPPPAVPVPSAPVQPVPLRLAFYRKYTEAMLRRYLQCSFATARIPAMLGREMFRGRVTCYRVRGFDDVIIFVHDVEKCLARLTPAQRLYLQKIAIEEFTQQETAELLQLPINTLVRRYNKAVDALTAIFLAVNLLEPQHAVKGASKARTSQLPQMKGDKTLK